MLNTTVRARAIVVKSFLVATEIIRIVSPGKGFLDWNGTGT
jgi:hypothetical protein